MAGLIVVVGRELVVVVEPLDNDDEIVEVVEEEMGFDVGGAVEGGRAELPFRDVVVLSLTSDAPRSVVEVGVESTRVLIVVGVAEVEPR